MFKSHPLLLGVALAGLTSLIAGVGAGIAKGGVPGPGWLGAGIVGALAAIGATVVALRPAVVKVVEAGVDRSIKQSEAARELRERLGGAKGRFLRVSEIRNRALRYGVQQAIPLDGGPVEGLSADLPRYLPRTIDGSLRSALTARSTTGGMVVLKGNSTWGKSRSMFEAVSQVLGDWLIVAPSNASDVRDLVESGLSLSRTVVWLDELVDFLTGGEPLRRGVVQRAVDKGAILVGTIWKDDFAALTDPPKKAIGDRVVRAEHDPGTVDELAEARAILMATYGDLIEMPRDLDENESAVALALAKQDSRWAHALADAGELSPIQVLAAAPQLLQRYRSPDDEAGGVVLRTAVALLAIEHPQPVPVELLRRVARVAISPTLELDSDRWFDEAVAWARRPVRGTIAPLKAYRRDAGDDPGYVAPDLLVSASREEGGFQSQVDLELTSTHASAEACATIGSFFYFRDEDDVAEPFLRRAAESGVVRSFRQYGYVLNEQEGREAEAEGWYLKAVDAAGDTPDALSLYNLGLITARGGRPAEAEKWFRKAAESGEDDAWVNLGELLRDQEGRAEEAEECLRRGVDLGVPVAVAGLGVLLAEQEGRAEEAEACLRRGVDLGVPVASVGLGMLLAEQEGRADEAEECLRKGVESGFSEAMDALADVLQQEGRAAEAEEWYLRAIDEGNTDALNDLGDMLKEQGRYAEARPILERGIAAGDPFAMWTMGELDLVEGRRDAARGWLQKAASLGVSGAGELFVEEFGDEPPSA